MCHRRAENGHDGIADEFVEHAAFGLNAVHHDGEVLVQHADRRLRPQFFGQCGEASDIGEQDGRNAALPAENFRARLKHFLGHRRVHITRHRGLETFLTGDVFDHHE